MHFTETDLFRRTLKPAGPGDSRERLYQVLLRFRERAAMLAQEIHRDLPDFTVHDITHLDALWEMADLIAGPDYPLTPLEALALGGVFLLHDLGLGLAAYPGGPDEIKQGLGWKDTLSAHLRKHFDRLPTEEELISPPPEIERAAIGERLRVLHAERAEKLALAAFQDPGGGAAYHLIEDPDLRMSLGPLLGRIAHSHWWPVSRLGNEFGMVMGALPYCPRDWTLDPLKVAVLLRTADAAHLDARRAPGFLRALRRPEAFSREHWLFQEHLLKPRIEEKDDRLMYTTARPFSVEEADAWWLCHETLQMVDRELHQVDALLADLHQPRLRARGVAGVESPLRLQDYVKISGWTPIDARIHVSNVADLVKRLGGEQLYGRDEIVPLRELIQNAADAVRARRLLEDRPDDWGRITVRLGQDDQGPWLEVEDNGIGMSEAVLSGPLLNFGTTYWGSALMREEHAGLLAKGFEPTGRFGIGFFSVFMWGHRVRVTTRRYEDAKRDTRILEFLTGLQTRPLVRMAKPEESLRDGVTCVRVWSGQRFSAQNEATQFVALCARVAPALDVDLYVEVQGESYLSVAANDWITLEGGELLARISLYGLLDRERELMPMLRLIRDSDGKILGRATLKGESRVGVIAIGGLRSVPVDHVVGILLGSAINAARDKGRVLADDVLLSEWASEQAKLIAHSNIDRWTKLACSRSVFALRGNPDRLPIAELDGKPVNVEDLVSYKKEADEVCVYNADVDWEYERDIDFNPNIVIIESIGDAGGTPQIKYIKEALMHAWGCSDEEVTIDSDYKEVGVRYGMPFESCVIILRRISLS